MNNSITIFNNEEFGEIRTVTIDGEIWFVGKDVATALGYSDTAKAIRVHVDDDDKKLFNFQGGRNGNLEKFQLWSLHNQ